MPPISAYVRAQPMKDALAVAVVSARGATRIRAGYPWVYRTDLIPRPRR